MNQRLGIRRNRTLLLSRFTSLVGFVVAVLLVINPVWAKQTDVAEVPSQHPFDRVQQISPQVQVEQLAPGLWLHRTERQLENGQVFTSNGLILQTAEGIWLLDTAWGYYPTIDLLHWIQTVLKKPVVKAIATHAHDDRLGGVQALAERQIPLWVTQQTFSLAPLGVREHLTVATSLAAGQSFQDGTVTWFYPGAGHTHDNIVLYLPQYRLLVGGCIVKAPKYAGLGNIADADLVAWPVSLTRIQQTFSQMQTVVPGHGAVGDVGLITYSLSLLSPVAESKN